MGGVGIREDRRRRPRRVDVPPGPWRLQSVDPCLTAGFSGVVEANWSLRTGPPLGVRVHGRPREGLPEIGPVAAFRTRRGGIPAWRYGDHASDDRQAVAEGRASIMRVIKCLKSIRWMPWC